MLLDQRRLPEEVVELECRSAAEVAEAIRTLAVRGAPAIGIAAAYGLRARGRARGGPRRGRGVLARLPAHRRQPRLGARRDARGDQTPAALAERARALHDEEVERCRRDGRARRRPARARARASLTHCNAGALATGGVRHGARRDPRAASSAALVAHVFVDETRPLLQGARLTAWELERAGIPHSVVADGAAGSLMARGEVDAVLTGADRIAANGDAANKIGTYPLAVLARPPRRPVLRRRAELDGRPRDAATAPTIPIEERDPARGDRPLPGAEPGLRRDPGRADRRRSSPRTGVHRPPYERVAGRPRPHARGDRTMKAMVMAAGLGTRLRPLTDFLPKPMMPVANRPVLHHLLNLLRRHDVTEVGINLHAFPEMIQRYFGDGSALDMSILLVGGARAARHGRGTKKLQDYWGDETILITSGDGLHDVDLTALLGHHQRTGALATLTVKPVPDPSSYGVVILDRDTRVRGFQEKPRRDEARSDLANCGIYVIEPELLERIPAGHVLRLRRGRLAEPRRGRGGGLRVHDDGLLERRRRPRRAPQHDPRRRARPRSRRHPGRGDRARRLGGGRLQDPLRRA